MARFSKPLVLLEADLLALQELRKYGDKDASLRAEIVIACADDRTNKSIAQELSVTEATVKKWKEAFREKGLQGLVTEHTGGRKPSTPTPVGMEQAIVDIVSNHVDDGLTASAIAEQLQVDVSKVYYVLRKNGITLNRNRNWEYTSQDDMGGWNPPIICLYLSPSCSFIVASSNPWSKENMPVQGIFVTRDKALEDELERSLIRVSLLGILKTASRISTDSSARTPKPGSVIEEAVAQWDTDKEAEFYIFCYGDAFSYEGKRSKQSHINHYDSLDEMKAAFLHWMGGRCNADQHAKAEILLAEICRFCEQQQESSNAFIWYLRHNEVVQYSPGTEGAVTSETPLDGDNALVLPKAESWTNVEEMLNALLPEMDSCEPMTEAGAILYHRGKDGMIHYSHVPSSQKFQDMEEFSFGSKESFERDLSRLEEDTEGFMREVAEANYGMFLAGAKKNKT